MSDLRKAAQQALEAMEYSGRDVGKFNRINSACAALRAALAQEQAGPEPVADPFNCPQCGRHDYGLHGSCPACDKQEQPAPEPVAWYYERDGESAISFKPDRDPNKPWQPLYTTPEPVAWLRVIDEAMVTHHIGVADPADDYETAKRKMNNLLCHAQDIGAYFAAPQRPAEPVQEQAGCTTEAECTSQPWCGISGECHRKQAKPVAWLTPRTVDSYARPDLGYETSSKTDYGAFPVYTAPPQRKENSND